MQPLVSVGDYGAITEFSQPRTYDFLEYGRDVGSITPVPNTSLLEIDPDAAGPAKSFRISQPDFNIKSLRVNAVGRWEFRPGSTLFLVWTRFGNDRSNPGDFQFGRDVSDLTGITVPVRLTGSFAKPSYSIDFSGVAGDLAKRELQRQLERRLGGGTAPKEGTAPASPSGGGSLQDQLKGLLGR